MNKGREQGIDKRLHALMKSKGNLDRLGKELKMPGKAVPSVILIDDHGGRWAVFSDGTKGAISAEVCEEARKHGASFTLILPDISEVQHGT